MKRMMIQVTEEQYRTLKEMPAEDKVSISEQVREGVQMVTKQGRRLSREERIRMAKSVIGIVKSKMILMELPIYPPITINTSTKAKNHHGNLSGYLRHSCHSLR